jgi:hypothetical protein
MNQIHTETFSALLDGERVDLAELAAALEDPEARAALLDFAQLRHAAQAADGALPSSLERLRPRRRQVRRWPAIAAVLVLTFLAGLASPRPWDAEDHDPPEPTRVERFEPGIDWHPVR